MPDFTTVEKRLLRMAASVPDEWITAVDPREERACESVKRRGYLADVPTPKDNPRRYAITEAGQARVRRMAMS